MADPTAKKPVARLKGHKGPIHALTFSSGTGQYLLSGSSDKTINLYNPSKAINSRPNQASADAIIQSYSGVHGYEVLSISVAADNARFISAGGDKTVFLWDVATAQTLRRYGGGPGSHGSKVECTAFGGEGDSVVISGSFDSTVRFWDTKSGNNRPIMILDEAKDSVSSLAVSEHEVFTGSVDGRLRRYDMRMGMLSVDVIAVPITSVTPTLKADSILISTLDSTLRLMDKVEGKLLRSYKDPSFEVSTYRIRSILAEKDSLVLSGSEDGFVYAWDVLSGECRFRAQHNQDDSSITRASKKVASTVACKRKGGEWASAGGDGTITVWG